MRPRNRNTAPSPSLHCFSCVCSLPAITDDAPNSGQLVRWDFSKALVPMKESSPATDTHPVRCQHILRLLLFVLNVPLEGVPFQKEQLEERQLLLSRAGRCLSARRDGRRAALAHKLKLLDWWGWTINKRETARMRSVQKTARTRE